MSLKLAMGERIKLMRESERMSRADASEMWGLKHDALWRYEEGKSMPSAEVMSQIFGHPKFEKYTLWFITGKVAPEAGQIEPALAHCGQAATNSPHSDQKTG